MIPMPEGAKFGCELNDIDERSAGGRVCPVDGDQTSLER